MSIYCNNGAFFDPVSRAHEMRKTFPVAVKREGVIIFYVRYRYGQVKHCQQIMQERNLNVVCFRTPKIPIPADPAGGDHYQGSAKPCEA